MGAGERFDVRVLAWSVAADQAIAALIDALPIDRITAERLVVGAPLTVKRAVDRQTAARYLELLEQAGAQVEVARSGTGGAVGSSAPAMAHDVTDFVAARGRNDPSTRFMVEPMWQPAERDVVERARATPDPYDALAAGSSLAALSASSGLAADSADGGWAELEGLDAPKAITAPAPTALHNADNDLPPAPLAAERETADAPALLGNDGSARGSLGDQSAPTLELLAPRPEVSTPVPVETAADAQSLPPAQPSALAQMAAQWGMALRRTASDACERALEWAENNSDDAEPDETVSPPQRGYARARRELAVFLVWLVPMLQGIGQRGLRSVETLATRAPRGRQRASAQPGASHAPRSSHFPLLPQLILGLGIPLFAWQLDNSILLGNASPVSLCVHALAIFALGNALFTLLSTRR